MVVKQFAHVIICFINTTETKPSTVEPAVYYGHLGTNNSVLIFQVSLYDQAKFRTITNSVDYAGVLILKCPD